MDGKQKVIAGLRDAIAYAKGDASRGRGFVARVPDTIDVKAVRERLQMTQGEFALKFGFSLGTLRQWEQERRLPDGAARVFLTVISRDPDGVLMALKTEEREAKPRISAISPRAVLVAVNDDLPKKKRSKSVQSGVLKRGRSHRDDRASKKRA